MEGIAKRTIVGTSPELSSRSRGSVQNRSPQRMSHKRAHSIVESAHGSAGGGDDEEPPHGISDNSHDAHYLTRKKKSDIDAMIDIKDESEKMGMDSLPEVLDWVSTKILKINSFVEDIATHPLVEYDDDTLLVNKSTYDQTTRKLNLQNPKVKGKKLQEVCAIEVNIGRIDMRMPSRCI